MRQQRRVEMKLIQRFSQHWNTVSNLYAHQGICLVHYSRDGCRGGCGGCAPPSLGKRGCKFPCKIIIYQPIKLQQLSNCTFPGVSSQTHKKFDITTPTKEEPKSNPNKTDRTTSYENQSTPPAKSSWIHPCIILQYVYIVYNDSYN